MSNIKVTEKDVASAVTKETFTVLPDGRTTVCQLTLHNGFTLIGTSAVVDPSNFNEAEGQKWARESAMEKVWQFLGWDLQSKVHLLNSAGEPTGDILKFGAPTTYVGAKVVRALPMVKAAYCQMRGWDVPANEEAAELGYLIEYVDGGKPNIFGFTGYISWSPKDVFESAYTTGIQIKTSSFLDRLTAELDQTAERLKKLRSFLGSDASKSLDGFNRSDLEQQEKVMKDLVTILERRVSRLI